MARGELSIGKATWLGRKLVGRRFTRVFLAGLAFDFCVRYSAEDARHEGFAVKRSYVKAGDRWIPKRDE